MSERRLHYSPLSLRDLDEIFDYIANELRNPSAAKTTIEDILDGVEELEKFPFIGSIVDNLPFAADEYRFLGVRNYLVFYRVSESDVFVDRVLCAKREYRSLLRLQ